MLSEVFYLSYYPDVKAAVDAGQFSSGQQHYDLFGRAEGRRTAAPSYFDESYYLKTNPDVARGIQEGDFVTGFHHFTIFGMKEGRDASASLSEDYYLQANPDVALAVASGQFASGMQHYDLFGQTETRSFRGRPLIEGTVGNDTITTWDSSFVLSGDGDDLINLGTYAPGRGDVVYAGAGNDSVLMTTHSQGIPELRAGGPAEVHGEAGDDRLRAPVMYGGAGADVFEAFIYSDRAAYRGSEITIQDWQNEIDRIDVSSFRMSVPNDPTGPLFSTRALTWADIENQITYTDGNATVVVPFTNGASGLVTSTVTLLDAARGTLGRDDFIFAS
ncbi:hypothetical protein [Azospirillum sp. SYSU D00513]|uniref:hypothetical protein n=1 Tax=Azospirillum sp. SYSU D00513 TaxID=2812561 RepID=UPI001A95668C|nr:hypothetical protein [Azospirillum sp. SYSU D00513]